MSTIAQGMSEGGDADLDTASVWAWIGSIIGILLLAGVFFIVWSSVTTKPTIPPTAFATMNTANKAKP
jgi:hypothetical protein